MILRSLSRRDFLRASAIASASAMLTACLPQPAPAQPSVEEEPKAKEAEPTTAAAAPEGAMLTLWVGWGENYAGPLWDEFRKTDEFNKIISPNTVEVKGSVGRDVVLTAVAGGNPPDSAGNIQYYDYMSRGALLDLASMASVSTYIKEADFFPGNWQMGMYDGKQYGVPANEGFVRFGLNYNARMVEEAGLDPDDPPLTWDKALEWHKALTKFDSAGNLLQIGLDPTDAMGEGIYPQDGFMVAASWNFKWFDEKTGKFNLNNEQMIDALNTFKEFFDVMGVDNLAGLRSTEGNGSWGGSYNAEVQAMIIEGYWHCGETANQKPEVAEVNRSSWLPVPPARAGAKVQGNGGHLFTIFKDAKHPQEAFKIAEFLNTDAACDIIFKMNGWLPPRPAYIEKTDPSAFPGLDFYFKAIDEANEWYSEPRCPISGFVDANYSWDLREKVFRGELTAEEAVQELQTRCEEEYQNQGFGA